MKSKTFCFNKTVFHKNMTLYWPLWSIYLAGMLFIMPFHLWAALRSAVHTTNALAEKKELCFYAYTQILDVKGAMLFIFIMAVVFAMAYFGYLFQSRSANMIHALPVTRKDLYGTNLISGIVSLVVPLAICFVLCVFLCLFYGISDVQYLGEWFLVTTGIAVACYGMAVLCVMLTGQMFAVAAYYVIGNFLYVSVRSIISMIISQIAYGVSYSNVVKAIQIEWLSPMYYMFRLVNFEVDTHWVEKDGYVMATGVHFTGAGIVLGYTVLGMALFLLSGFLYQRRELERAGDFLTISFIKPIFRWGAGSCIGLLCAYVSAALFDQMNLGENRKVIVISVLFFGILFFFLAQMVISKSFRVFSKKRWIECVCYGVFLLGVCGGMKMTAQHLENRIVDLSDVKRAFLYLDYPIEYNGTDAELVTSIQKEILAGKEQYLDAIQNTDAYVSVELSYELKNGGQISRSYLVPTGDCGEDMIEKIRAIEQEPDNFFRNFICYDYDKIQIRGGTYESYDAFYNYKGSKDISEETAQKLFEAVKADAEDGSIQFYNGSDYDDEAEKKPYTSNLYLEYCPPEGSVYEDMYERYGMEEHTVMSNGLLSWSSVSYETAESGGGYGKTPYTYKKDGTWTISLTFGPECTHTVKALIDNGLIESESELCVKASSLNSDDE